MSWINLGSILLFASCVMHRPLVCPTDVVRVNMHEQFVVMLATTRTSSPGINPFRAPEPLPILNPSNFVPKNGCPVVKGFSCDVSSVLTTISQLHAVVKHCRRKIITVLNDTYTTRNKLVLHLQCRNLPGIILRVLCCVSFPSDMENFVCVFSFLSPWYKLNDFFCNVVLQDPRHIISICEAIPGNNF